MAERLPILFLPIPPKRKILYREQESMRLRCRSEPFTEHLPDRNISDSSCLRQSSRRFRIFRLLSMELRELHRSICKRCAKGMLQKSTLIRNFELHSSARAERISSKSMTRTIPEA